MKATDLGERRSHDGMAGEANTYVPQPLEVKHSQKPNFQPKTLDHLMGHKDISLLSFFPDERKLIKKHLGGEASRIS